LDISRGGRKKRKGRLMVSNRDWGAGKIEIDKRNESNRLVKNQYGRTARGGNSPRTRVAKTRKDYECRRKK